MMVDLPLATEPPFDGWPPDEYESEAELRHEANERARYFMRKHDLREPLAYTAAIAQQGAAVPRRIGSSAGTVSGYLDEIEERFGTQAIMPKQKQHRTGPLDEGTIGILTGPDDDVLDERDDDVPSLDDDPRVIPDDLLARDQWLIREGKVPKAPWAAGAGYDRGGGGGDDPTNDFLWADFETADRYLSMLPTPKWGLYFVIEPSDPFAAIDLDDCRDPETGDLDDRARDIVARADAFAEISPSGTGVHIYVRGSVPDDRTNGTEGVELYDNRQMTVTGDHLDGTPIETPERRDVLDDLADEFMTADEANPHPEAGIGTGTEAGPASGRRDPDHGVEPWSPFDALRVTDVYPELPAGTNVAHPEHDSKTGQNFRIAGDGHTATCWHAQHRVGAGDGCGLGACHLLAMRATGATDCRAIRERWADDDELVFETWRRTIEDEDHIDIDPSPPPWRALRFVGDEHDIGGLDSGGASAHTAFRIVHRIIRVQYGIPVVFDADDADDEATDPPEDHLRDANPGFDRR